MEILDFPLICTLNRVRKDGVVGALSNNVFCVCGDAINVLAGLMWRLSWRGIWEEFCVQSQWIYVMFYN